MMNAGRLPPPPPVGLDWISYQHIRRYVELIYRHTGIILLSLQHCVHFYRASACHMHAERDTVRANLSVCQYGIVSK